MQKDSMRVKVYAPGFLSRGQLDPEGTLLLDPGTTLDALYIHLHMPEPFRRSFYCSVNDLKAAWTAELHDGDKVVFMYPMAGG
jgi:molybdopterin converting factor small subunit